MKANLFPTLKKVSLIFAVFFFLSLFVSIFFTTNQTFGSNLSGIVNFTDQKLQRLSDNISIVIPEEIGLPYLSHEPVILADNDIISSIRYAERKVARLPEDAPFAFDLGTNSPIRIGSMNDESSIRTDYKAVGYIDTRGKARPFDTSVMATMFSSESRNGGRLAFLPDYEETNLIADASGNLAQASRVRFFTLLVYSEPDNKIYRVSQVNPNSVCRDALNGVLNETMIRLPRNILRRF